jgi:P-type Cu2+ transporter
MLHPLTSINYDAPFEWQLFSLPVNPKAAQPNVWRSHLTVSGMHCAGCAIKLETGLAAVPGVLSSQVNAASAQVSILWDSNQTQPSSWMSVAQFLGYELVPADKLGNEDHIDQQARIALWRCLVAVFCMMQIMMYAAPQYFSEPGEISSDLQALLRWASWVLSLPIIFFSSGPFFSAALRDLLARRISMDLPVALGIAITFLVSSAATFDPNAWWAGEVYFDSLAMFVSFILCGRWLERRMRQKTARTLHLLGRGISERTERLLPSGLYESIATSRLVVGDTIRVLPGQRLPADGQVMGASTFVNEAFLTGESKPLSRACGDQVFAGSYAISSPCEMKVERLGESTRFAQIEMLMRQASMEKPKIALLADRIAKPFLVFILVAAALAAAYWWQQDPVKGLMAAVAILIITCPCALSLATPSAMLNCAGGLANLGVLMRRPQGIEALAQIDTIIFDKTGTLTEPQLELKKIAARPGIDNQKYLEFAAALAQHSLHPVARVLANYRTALGANEPVFSNVREVTGEGIEAELITYGELNAAHVSAGRIRLGTAKFCGLAESAGESGHLYLADQRGLVARFEISERSRSDAQICIDLLKSYGLKVRLMSGDKLEAAQKIAAELGINVVDANCSPETKLRLLLKLQQEGCKVMMIGDGINDGPAIAAANASIALGKDVPITEAKADFIIPHMQLSMIPMLYLQARRTMHVIRQNLLWAAAYNAACIPLALMGYLPAWAAGLGMASSSFLVIANTARLARIKSVTEETKIALKG